MTALLEIADLHVHYGHGRQLLRASDGVTLSVAKGETVGLVGESGSGKSTIGRAVVCLAPVTSGSVCFDGTEIARASRAERRRLSADIQMVFQDPFSSLNPARTIGQTLVEPLLVHHASMGEAQRSARVTEMLAKVELPADAAQRYPAQFSGGQRQRIAIARALMLSPRLVICDEPVSALDLSIQAQVLNLLADLRDEFDVAYLFIAHDLAVVRHLAHRTIVLYKGRIMESGPAAAVNDDPKHPYSQALVAAAPVPDPEVQRARSIARSEATSTNHLRTPDPINACPFASRCPSAMDRCWSERPELTAVDDGRAVACFLY
jgi:oligopeptide/dipeptide ABC transporter ATP-binding protein